MDISRSHELDLDQDDPEDQERESEDEQEQQEGSPDYSEQGREDASQEGSGDDEDDNVYYESYSPIRPSSPEAKPQDDGLDSEISLQEVQFFHMNSQGNIFTLANLPKSESRASKLIAACLSRPIYAMDFMPEKTEAGIKANIRAEENGSRGTVLPKKEVARFSYIPPLMEINSMTAFSRNKGMNDYVVGIAMYKQPKEDINVHDDHCYGQFLNIYFDHDHPGQLNSLVSSCITVKLDFLPYMLTHCEVPLPIPKMNNLTETVFLCGGSDNRVHMFLADKMRHTYVEGDIAEVFPEFAMDEEMPYPSPPIWIESLYLNWDKTRRISAIGLECGALYIRLVKLSYEESPKVLESWDTVSGAGHTTKMQFFYLEEDPVKDEQLPRLLASFRPSVRETIARQIREEEENPIPDEMFDDNAKITWNMSKCPLNLLVVNSLTESYVYHDILNQGITHKRRLPQSNKFDSQNSGVAVDVDFDGMKEILICTFGQELLCYNYDESRDSWRMTWRRSYPDPLLRIEALDVTGDGTEEIVMMSNRGVHVLKHDEKEVEKLRLKRLKNFLSERSTTIKKIEEEASSTEGT